MSLFLILLSVLPFCIFGKERYFTCVRSRSRANERQQARICFVKQMSNSDCKSACMRAQEDLKTKMSTNERISALVIEGQSMSKCYDEFLNNNRIDVKRHACNRADFWLDESPVTKKMKAQVDNEKALVVRREMALDDQNVNAKSETEVAVPQEAHEAFLGACLGWLWNRVKDRFFRRSGIFSRYADFINKARYFKYCFPHWKMRAIRDHIKRYRNDRSRLKNLPYVSGIASCVKGRFYQRYFPNPALQVGFSVSGAIVLGVSGSVDYAVNLNNNSRMTTVTGCWGIKSDASIGIGVFVALFGNMNDIPGDSVVVSAGADIPGTEVGLSFAQVWSTNNRDLYAVVVDVGAGYGLSPLDVSCSRCRTGRVWADAQDVEEETDDTFISSRYVQAGGVFFVMSILLAMGLFKMGGKSISNPSYENILDEPEEEINLFI